MKQTRQLNFIDLLCSSVDNALRTLTVKPPSQRPVPGADLEANLSEPERKQAAKLMRVNHCGEICAQALYQGQALGSRSHELREKMQHAASEENDHLNWCETRLAELDSGTSLLNPLFYAGSFAIGLGAALVGDKWSLGFLAATEDQVSHHLDSHLNRLPQADTRSQAIVKQMKIDEEQHAQMARDAGAAELPTGIKTVMSFSAKVMTSTTPYI